MGCTKYFNQLAGLEVPTHVGVGVFLLIIATLIGIDVKVIVRLWASYQLQHFNDDCEVLSRVKVTHVKRQSVALPCMDRLCM